MSFVKLPTRKSGNLDELLRIVKGVLEDEKQSKSLLETKGEDAQLWLDALQALAEFPDVPTKVRSSVVKIMLHLSKRSGLCPQCLMIKNVKRLGDFPVGGGGFGDVWKGKIGGQVVCLKVVKVYLVSDVQQLFKEYMREAIVWQQLQHPNLLPFMGMYYLDKARGQLCLVSPWMERGNLVRFLKDTPREQIDHYSLIYDVASGLLHLHGMKITHGDLKGVNILITPDERACIGDFGLSRVADTHALRLTSSTNTHSKGTTRWLSPELLQSDPPCTSSTRSDIYAFACVCYEIFTGNVPFYELTEGAVIVAVLLDKKHPSHPRLTPLNDQMWNIMVSCWKAEPQLRPSASEVFAQLDGLNSSKTGRRIKSAFPWDVLNLNRFWKNVKRPHFDTATLVELQKRLSRPATTPLAITPAPETLGQVGAPLAPTPALKTLEQMPDSAQVPKFRSLPIKGARRLSGEPVKVRVHFLQQTFILGVSPSIKYAELALMLCRKFSRDVRAILIEWENLKEFGHMVTLITDRDVQRALGEQYEEGQMPTLHVWGPRPGAYQFNVS